MFFSLIFIIAHLPQNLINGCVAHALDTFLSLTNTAYGTATENRETYVRDGITLQDGDSYVDVRLHYDMGVECHDFRFYFRNGYPLVTNLEQSVVRWDDDALGLGVATQNAEEYDENGYFQAKFIILGEHTGL